MVHDALLSDWIMSNLHAAYSQSHTSYPYEISGIPTKITAKNKNMTSDYSKLFIGLFSFLCYSYSYGQLSPPGLGTANTASWLAFGLQHKLDSAGTKYAVAYLGMGRKSTLTNDNPFGKPAIGVVNYELYNKLAKNKLLSYAFSYRRSTDYSAQEPYHKEGIEQEFRLYGRYAYTVDLGSWKWKHTVRQEFRAFFDDRFNAVAKSFQLRTRLKTQFSYAISPKNKQSISISAETLFAISYLNNTHTPWTKFRYKELRLGLYYSTQLPNTPLTLDIGYMSNLLQGSKHPKLGVQYLAADLIWKL